MRNTSHERAKSPKPHCRIFVTAHEESGRSLLWNEILPLKPPLHALVSEIDRIAEHERAAPDDAVDTAHAALLNGLLRNAAVPKGAVEPHAPYAMVTALAHDLD